MKTKHFKKVSLCPVRGFFAHPDTFFLILALNHNMLQYVSSSGLISSAVLQHTLCQNVSDHCIKTRLVYIRTEQGQCISWTEQKMITSDQVLSGSSLIEHDLENYRAGATSQLPQHAVCLSFCRIAMVVLLSWCKSGLIISDASSFSSWRQVYFGVEFRYIAGLYVSRCSSASM